MAEYMPNLETDSDWEEEEVLVYAELDECVDLSACHSVHILGIDSAKPVLQLDDNYFQGKYVPAVGTYMFFEPDEDAHSSDPLFDRLPEKNVKYVCKTSKLINFSRVYLDPKEAPNETQETVMGENTKQSEDRKETVTTVAPESSKPSEVNQEIEEFKSLEEVLLKFENAFKEPQENVENSSIDT